MSEAPTSRRRSAPKGRGGCSTCKSRHVRCDETKPKCTPCQKSSRQCEYLTDLVRPHPDQLKVVMWQPKGLAVRPVSPSPNHTSDERRGFEFFRTRVAINLGGFFKSTFWTEDVLRAAQHEPSIHHALVALASLSENKRTDSKLQRDNLGNNHDNDENGRSLTRSSSPEAFAIRQHAKAVSTLNRRIDHEKGSSPEVVLTACALLICFEMLNNNHESALRQMSSGVFLYCKSYSKSDRDAGTAASQLDGLALHLRQVFRRLLLQVIMFVDTRMHEWQFADPAFICAIPSIPSVFDSIDEARDYLDNYLYSTCHGTVTSQLQSLGDRQNHGLEAPKAQPSTSSSEATISSDSPLQQWKAAFMTFLAVQKTPLSSEVEQAVTLLEVQHIVGCILVSAGIFSSETSFDAFEEDFSRIVYLASCLIDNKGESPQDLGPICPAFDMGILPPLYFTATRCRHPTIRRQALYLMRDGPSQEGIWHSGMLSNIAERIIDLEEVGCADIWTSADVPAANRISVLNATINSAERTVALHCCRLPSEDAGTAHVIHELVLY